MGFLYPWTNMHDVNQDWLIAQTKECVEAVKKIPSKTSQLINDSGFVNSAAAAAAAPVQSVNGMTGDVIVPGGGGGAVDSVNGQTGTVVLTAADVGAMPDSYAAPVDSVNGQTGAVVLTAADVGAKPSTYSAPVDSVNGQTGAVVLTAADVGAKPSSYSAPVDSVNGQTGVVSLTIPAPSDNGPLMDGNASGGSSDKFSRSDHRHPKDTSKANLASPTFTGTPKAPTAAAGTDTTQLATTAFVQQEMLAAGVLSGSTAITMSTPEQTTSNLKLNMNFTKLGRLVMVQVAITVTGNLATGDYTFPTLDTTNWPLSYRPIAQARQTTTRWPIALEGFGSLRISPGSTGNVVYQCGQAISASGDTYINANLTYISME